MPCFVRFFGALLVAGTFSIALPASADTLYTQAYAGTAVAQSSQNDPLNFGAYATSYDDFTLAAAATISNVAWTGQFFDPPNPGAITSFTIDFYSNAGGVPGTLLSSTSIAGNGSQTLLDNTNQIYTYNDAVNFSAATGTEYWMSIVATLDFPPQWGWSYGTGGDGSAYQVYMGTGAPLANDFAFTLSGTPTGTTPTVTPEPASLALLGTGLVGLTGTLRRRLARV